VFSVDIQNYTICYTELHKEAKEMIKIEIFWINSKSDEFKFNVSDSLAGKLGTTLKVLLKLNNSAHMYRTFF